LEADNGMCLDVTHYPEVGRLYLTIEGNLDLTLTSQILAACEFVDGGLVICVIDATKVARVFDSGLAVLMLLASRLEQFRVRLVIIGDIAGLKLDTLPAPLLRRVVCISCDRLPPVEELVADFGGCERDGCSSRSQQYLRGLGQ
jgi:ABC-type transporter Mla MlaB component